MKVWPGRRDRKEIQGGREECLGRNGGVVRKIREEGMRAGREEGEKGNREREEGDKPTSFPYRNIYNYMHRKSDKKHNTHYIHYTDTLHITLHNG